MNTASATSIPALHETDRAGWRWAPIFVLLYVALWPAPGYAEGILVLGALATLVYLMASRGSGHRPLLSVQAWALTSVLFAAYWLPQLISAIDAVDAGRSLSKALTSLRHLPFLWLVATAVAHPRGRRITLNGLAVIVLVWTLDALIETVTGTSPLFWSVDHVKQLLSGRRMCPPDTDLSRVSGVFGPCNVKLGVVLASLSPFLLYAAVRRFGIGGWIIAAALVGAVIVLSGMRAAWLTFALVIVCSGLHLFGWKKALAGLLGGTLLFGILALSVPYVGQRLATTTQAMQYSHQSVDAALSGRLRVWSAAWCMYAEHPINGVGTRRFRDAFSECDPAPDRPSLWGEGPAFHAHQIVLEIASETGTLGLLLWLAGIVLAWRAWRFAPPTARDQARPAMLAVLVTIFPLNTHLAFYSTLWGGLALMLAALYTGCLFGRMQQESTPAAPP